MTIDITSMLIVTWLMDLFHIIHLNYMTFVSLKSHGTMFKSLLDYHKTVGIDSCLFNLLPIPSWMYMNSKMKIIEMPPRPNSSFLEVKHIDIWTNNDIAS